MSDSILHPDFARQRRNLIVISMGVIFIKFARLSVEKFTFLGMSFSSFENPQAIYLAIWLVFFYFCVRYYQYFMQFGKAESFHRYHELVSHYYYNYAVKIMEKLEMDYFEPTTFYSLKSRGWVICFGIKVHDEYSAVVREASEEKKISIVLRYYFSLKSLLANIFYRSTFTDYWLPIALAIFALAYGFSGGESSLMEALSPFNL